MRSAPERSVADLRGAEYFDQREFLRSTYAGYRHRMVALIYGGLIAVPALILARYRRLRPTLAALAPAVLAGTTALAVVGLAGVTANLLI